MQIESPFACGQSPFKIKGVAYRGQFDFYEDKVPGGKRAVLDAVDDKALRAFLEQPFIASASYDIFPLARLHVPTAKLMGMEPDELIVFASRYQAEYDLRGIYKVILRAFNPLQVMEKIARVSAQYFNFATVIQTTSVGPQRAKISRPAYPSILVDWYRLVLLGYLPVAVARTGAKDVQMEFHGEATGTEAFGVPLVDFDVHVSWR